MVWKESSGTCSCCSTAGEEHRGRKKVQKQTEPPQLQLNRKENEGYENISLRRHRGFSFSKSACFCPQSQHLPSSIHGSLMDLWKVLYVSSAVTHGMYSMDRWTNMHRPHGEAVELSLETQWNRRVEAEFTARKWCFRVGALFQVDNLSSK